MKSRCMEGVPRRYHPSLAQVRYGAKLLWEQAPDNARLATIPKYIMRPRILHAAC
jgi:hypothetical protein